MACVEQIYTSSHDTFVITPPVILGVNLQVRLSRIGHGPVLLRSWSKFAGLRAAAAGLAGSVNICLQAFHILLESERNGTRC